jgi:hypothetical protein
MFTVIVRSPDRDLVPINGLSHIQFLLHQLYQTRGRLITSVC